MNRAKLPTAVQMLQDLVSCTGQHLRCDSDETLIKLAMSIAQFGHKLLDAWYGRVVIVAGNRKVAARFEKNGTCLPHVWRLERSNDGLFSLSPCSMSGPTNQFISRGIGYDDFLAGQKGIAGLVEFAKNPESEDDFPPETAHIVELLCQIVGTMLVAWMPEKEATFVEIP